MTLELGGPKALILMPDADFDAAAGTLRGGSLNASEGQSSCSSSEISHVEAYVAQGMREARLVTGGGRPQDLGGGFFIEPTPGRR